MTTQASATALLQQPVPGIVVYPSADHIEPPQRKQIVESLEAKYAAEGPLRLLFVGNVIPRKGLHHLLEALAHVPRESAVLDVVGSLAIEPRYCSNIRSRIKSLDLQQQVTLHNDVPQATLRHHFRDCQLFVLPAFEGFGIAYLEAMGYGIPVIASTHGAAGEIVTPGVNGFLVDPADVRGMASIINEMSAKRMELCAYAVKARERYDGHPTWINGMKQAVTWLENIVQG